MDNQSFFGSFVYIVYIHTLLKKKPKQNNETYWKGGGIWDPKAVEGYAFSLAYFRSPEPDVLLYKMGIEGLFPLPCVRQIVRSSASSDYHQSSINVQHFLNKRC